MKFTLKRKTDLAIQALNVLAESDGQWRASELAEALDSRRSSCRRYSLPWSRPGEPFLGADRPAATGSRPIPA